MGLQLNEQVSDYKEFYGKNTHQMPLLIADGRTPISVADVMKRRLEVLGQNYSDEVRSAWWDNYIGTGDAPAYSPDGRIKIVLDSQPLRNINPKSKLKNSALVLPDGMYEMLEGLELTKDEIETYCNSDLTEKQVNQNPIWNVLARDESLLKEYSSAVFKNAKKRFGYDKNMGLYISSEQKVPIMRLWVVSRLENRSNASGRFNLGDGDGRLVGVREEAEGFAQKISPNLEQILGASERFVPEHSRDTYRERK